MDWIGLNSSGWTCFKSLGLLKLDLTVTLQDVRICYLYFTWLSRYRISLKKMRLCKAKKRRRVVHPRANHRSSPRCHLYSNNLQSPTRVSLSNSKTNQIRRWRSKLTALRLSLILKIIRRFLSQLLVFKCSKYLLNSLNRLIFLHHLQLIQTVNNKTKLTILSTRPSSLVQVELQKESQSALNQQQLKHLYCLRIKRSQEEVLQTSF